MEFVAERDQLVRWVMAKGEDGLSAYRQKKNTCSIDRLPAPLTAE